LQNAALADLDRSAVLRAGRSGTGQHQTSQSCDPDGSHGSTGVTEIHALSFLARTAR
jgi:hypothetical protein